MMIRDFFRVLISKHQVFLRFPKCNFWTKRAVFLNAPVQFFRRTFNLSVPEKPEETPSSLEKRFSLTENTKKLYFGNCSIFFEKS